LQPDQSGTWQVIIMAVLAVCGAISTFVSLKLANNQDKQSLNQEKQRSEFLEKQEKMRSDFFERSSALEKRIDEKLEKFADKFISQPLALEQKSGIIDKITFIAERIDWHDKEIETNRKHMHDLRETILKMVGPVMETQGRILDMVERDRNERRQAQ